MEEVGSEYKLVLLNGRRVREDELARALIVYGNNTPHSEKQPSNTFVYWAERYNSIFKDKLLIFALYKNQKMIGFAELVVFTEKSFCVLDYMTIEREEHRTNTFYEFFDLIRGYISSCNIVVDHIVAELLTTGTDGSPSRSSVVWESLLHLQGFRKIHAPYYQPQMGQSKETLCPGYLMIFSEAGIGSLRRDTYVDFVTTIYFDHYLRWFKPDLKNDSEIYEESLHGLLKKIESEIGSVDQITVNGEAPSIVVSPSSPVTKPGTNIAVFALPSIFVIIFIASSMSILMRFFDIESRNVLLFFSLSIAIYFSIISMVSRDAERVFTSFVRKLKFYDK